MSESPEKIRWFAFLLEDRSLSMGRIMAWVVFGILIYMWLSAVSVPASLLNTFFVLIGYNMGKKVTGPLAAVLQNKFGQQNPPKGSDNVQDRMPRPMPPLPPIEAPESSYEGSEEDVRG